MGKKQNIIIIRRIILLIGLMAGPFALAADGSGTGTVVPTGVVANSTGNDFTFTYTATEDMGDGAVRLTVPAGFPDPTPANTAVTVTDGLTGASIDTLDADPPDDWFGDVNGLVCLGCSVNLSTDTDPGDFVSGTGSLRAQIILNVGVGSSARIYHNDAAVQDWSDYTHLSFHIRKDALLTVDLIAGAVLRISEGSNLVNPVSYPLSAALLDVDLLDSGDWVQVIVDLSSEAPTTRDAVRSYGLVFPGLASLAVNGVLHIDQISAGPAGPVFSGNTVTQGLLFLNDGGKVRFDYTGITAPGEGSYTFVLASSIDASGDLTDIADSPVVTVTDLGDQPTTCEDVDGDSAEECTVDVDDPPNDCDDVFVDPDGSSCSVLVTDANGATDGNPVDCPDFFIDIDCDGGNCPDVYWDSKNGIVTEITPRDVDTDGDGDLEAVCAFDTDGDDEDDSFTLAGVDDGGDGGSDGGNNDGTETGGAGAGGPNPFRVQGGGCGLIR